MKKIVIVFTVLVGIGSWTNMALAWNNPTTKLIFDCHRTVIQQGFGGEEGVIKTYDALDDMLYYKHNTFKLAGIYRDCLNYLFDADPQGPMNRMDYYGLLNDLNGQHSEGEDQIESKLFILMAGLRDNVSKCASVTSAGMAALLFGPVVNGSVGICNNLEGKIYSKVVVGWGLNLGFGANVAVFVDNQLGIYPEESGDLGEILFEAADSLADLVLEQNQEPRQEWFKFLNVDIYAVSSLGLGPVYPLSFLVGSIEDEDQLENCLGLLIRLADDDTSIDDLDMTFEDFGECVMGARGIAVGAGLNFAVVFDFPLHFSVPVVRINHLLYDVIYRDVSRADINLVRARTDMMAGLAN